MANFKVKLLTPMVDADASYTAGQEIEVPNDRAWRLVDAGLAELKGKNKPEKPKDVIEAEKAAEESKQVEENK